MSSNQIKEISDLLDSNEIIDTNSPDYQRETQVWAAQKNLHPKLVVRPRSIESLAAIVKKLAKSDLQFNVRAQGYGVGSAKDVLISLSAFDDFSFDRENEIVTLGAGQSWTSYYEKMEKVAPDYQVVSIRTPAIGVGGSVLCGGYSWLSREFGCTSDPLNMIDAQVMKLDGSVIWASKEPDLLWALRGSGGGFGIVLRYKLRAHKYSQKIWCGPIIVPRSAIAQIAKGLALTTSRNSDPKMSLFLYIMPKELLGIDMEGDDLLVVHAFDGAGEEHGRSEEGFKWALDVPGAIDMTRVMNLREVSQLQDKLGSNINKSNFYASPVALNTKISEETVYRAFEWFDKISALGPSFRQYSLVLFELLCIREPVDAPPTSVAWRRPTDVAHYLLLGCGHDPNVSAETSEKAKQLLIDAPGQILGKDYPVRLVSNYVEDFHDLKDMFGENYEKLLSIKKKYDPRNRLPGPIQVRS